MSNYIHIQQGPYKVLMRANNGCWNIIIAGKSIDLSPSIERFWAYWIFVKGSKKGVAAWIREVLRIDIVPTELDEVVQYFKQEHPKEELAHYSLAEVPTAASSKGLELPIPYYCATISLKQEKQLLERIRREPYKDAVMQNLESWFSWFVEEYGYNLKKCKGEEAFYLAESFLQQHAIDIELLPVNNALKTDGYGNGMKLLQFILYLILIPAFIGAAIYFGSLLMNKHFFLGFVLLFIGFVAFSYFLNWLFHIKK